MHIYHNHVTLYGEKYVPNEPVNKNFGYKQKLAPKILDDAIAHVKKCSIIIFSFIFNMSRICLS